MKARILLILIVLMIVSACSSLPEPVAGKVKILYWDDKMFTDDYGSIISAKLPNIAYEVVSIPGSTTKEFIDYIKLENPDVIFMRSYEEYLHFIESGMLDELDTWVRKDKYDIESIHQGVIQMLRDNEGEKLFGLTPIFSSMAMYYNKDLFTKYGVPEPRDRMTWDEIFLLASRFQAINDVYGYSTNNTAYDLIEIIGNTFGQKIISSDQQHRIDILKDEPFWERIFEQVNQAVHNRTMAIPETASQLYSRNVKQGVIYRGEICYDCN